MAHELGQLKNVHHLPRGPRAVICTLWKRFGWDTEIRGVEVGVETGRTSAHLLRLFPNLHLTLVDSWDARNCGTTDASQLKQDSNLIETLNYIAPYRDRTRLIVDDSLHAAHHKCKRGEFDFLFLDADHSYEGCMQDLNTWVPRCVRNFGLVIGDDYGGRREKKGQWGVKRAVDEFADFWLTVRTTPLNVFYFEVIKQEWLDEESGRGNLHSGPAALDTDGPQGAPQGERGAVAGAHDQEG